MRDRRVLLADDVRNTGKTFERCAALVREAGGEVLATVQIYDRLESVVDLGVPNIALIDYQAPENFAGRPVPPVPGRNADHAILKRILDAQYEAFNVEDSATDPVQFVHRTQRGSRRSRARRRSSPRGWRSAASPA